MLATSCFSRKEHSSVATSLVLTYIYLQWKQFSCHLFWCQLFASLCRLLITFAHSLDPDQAWRLCRNCKNDKAHVSHRCSPLTLLCADVGVMETNVSQSPPFLKRLEPSQHALYSAPTILEITKDLGVVDFPELLGTHTVSHCLFWKWNNSQAIFFSARTKYSQRTRTCKHTDTILMYKKGLTNFIQHNDSPWELKTIWIENQQRLSSFSAFLWVYFSSFQFDNGLVEEGLPIPTCIHTNLASFNPSMYVFLLVPYLGCNMWICKFILIINLSSRLHMYLAICMISVLVYFSISWYHKNKGHDIWLSLVLFTNGPVHFKISILHTTGFSGSWTATYFGVTFKLL